jgi:hypothetical protein
MAAMRAVTPAVALVACACFLGGASVLSFTVGRTTTGPSHLPQRLRIPRTQEAPSTSYGGNCFIGLVVGVAVTASLIRRPSLVKSNKGAVVCHAVAGLEAGSEGPELVDFDPCNFTKVWPEHLPWFREAELKHGRVCMLAYVGLVVQDSGIELIVPDTDIVTAHNACIDGLGGPMWYLAIFIGGVESLRFKQLGLGFEKLTLENAGDLNFGKFFLPKDPEAAKQMKLKELKNGRLAMLAFGGAITQSVAWDCHHFPFIPVN